MADLAFPSKENEDDRLLLLEKFLGVDISFSVIIFFIKKKYKIF